MKRKGPMLLLIVLSMAGVFFSARWLMQTLLQPPPAQSAEADPAHLRIGEQFLDHLDADRHAEAMAMTSAEMQAALSAEKLGEIWQTLPQQLGERRSRSPLRGERVGDVPVVTSTLSFGLLALDARIVVEADGRISGFRLVPASAPAEPAPLKSNAQFSESDFPVGQGSLQLPGTLSLPQGTGPFPAVLLVHGSGPHDRDESIGPNKPFRDIAHGLAARGIAVLRYEKRSKAHPEAFASADFTVDDEVTDDAVTALATLRADARIDARRLYVAGHSLGGMMAPRIAQQAADREGLELAGLILLAAPARPLQDIVPEQVQYLAALDGDISAEERASLDDISTKAAAVATLQPDTPAADTLLGLPARYWIDLRDYDPVNLARQLPHALLLIQGGRDYQVTSAGDFARWQAAFDGESRAQLRLYPALNHLLMPGEGSPNPAEYTTPGRVDGAVIEAMAEFVQRGL